jgi:hypothetical protein
LKSIFGILVVAQNPVADAQHLRAVTPNQYLECGLVAPSDEPIQ